MIEEKSLKTLVERVSIQEANYGCMIKMWNTRMCGQESE